MIRTQIELALARDYSRRRVLRRVADNGDDDEGDPLLRHLRVLHHPVERRDEVVGRHVCERGGPAEDEQRRHAVDLALLVGQGRYDVGGEDGHVGQLYGGAA